MKQSNCILPGGEFRNYNLWRDAKNYLPVLFGGLLYYYTNELSNLFRYVGIAALVTKGRNGDEIADGDIDKKGNADDVTEI